jgi:hypothetical protein
MRLNKAIFCCFFIFTFSFIFAQTHTSVPLESHIYYILEQAEIKGLCAPLPGVRPYMQSVILRAINEILDTPNAGRLNNTEREILEQYMERFSKPKTGMDLRRGGYYNEATFSKYEIPISINANATLDIEGSAGFYDSLNDNRFGTEIWLGFFVNGDLGRHVSYKFGGEGGLMKVPRKFLGEYNTYYEGFEDSGEYQNQVLDIYSEPLTHFPYSYRKRWDASVHFFSDLSSFDHWPDRVAGSYNLLSELTASFIDDKLTFRLGRLRREWGSISFGSSLHLNQTARPFLGIEAEFNPFSWFRFATMTGILEFDPVNGIKGMNNQNAYSISMLQLKYKNYLFLDIGDAVVWPKRFELGYISPITNIIFYQNNIGDFDNISAMVNIKAQYPGIGNIWVSLFWDEAYWVFDWYKLDRTMLAGQIGLNFTLPFLSFSSVKLSYTKINPYCYTHNRNYNPWYGDLPMETAYTNNGVSLGYYLPPNSDELLINFTTMPKKNITASLQYQMIRHGADFGTNAVDGSNLLSELDPNGRDTNEKLKRFFLHDGAYQWMHIIKLGGEWTLEKTPLAFYWEIGTVISFFTNTKEAANSGKEYTYEIIDTSEYPRSTSFIVKLGIRLFPR